MELHAVGLAAQWTVGACALGWTLACAPSSIRVHAEVPLEVDRVAMTLDGPGRHWATGLLRITGDQGPIRIELPDDFEQVSAGRLVAYDDDRLLLARPPANDLERIPIEPAEPERSRLPSPTWAARGSSDGEVIEMTTDLSPPALTAGWLPECPAACEVLPLRDARRWPLPGSTTGVRAVVRGWFDESAALVATLDGQLYEMRETGATRLTQFSGLIPSAFSADSTQDGSVWVLSSDSLLRVTSEGVTSEGVQTFAPVNGANGHVTAHGDEVFVCSSDGLMKRVGDHLEVLYASDETRASQFAQCAWVGFDSVLAVFSDAELVVTYTQGAVTVDRSVAEPRSAVFSDVWGPLLVDSNGRIHHREADAWVPIDPTQPGLDVRGVLPVGSGFLLGSSTGNVAVFQPGIGGCDLPPVLSGSVATLMQIGASVVFAGTRSARTEGDTQIATAKLEPADYHPGCTDYL